ncbi:bile acid:sodium symporter family protein [Salinisphaera japonica]|uniref:Sodium transporter n=1 Tax=Salinisphaera japonica YTM-1 TaxID=1209778 RepID=A0A423PVZ8_9GAMM|nr:bile acid:sodium symporter family protein [Salinisphaera japonica]ROO29786.1 sodium transporter [Salinisphaera japonica YTM-1]
MKAPGTTAIALGFPLYALVMAGAGYGLPAVFAPGAFLIVPFLILIMFGMGLTLKAADFKRAVSRWPVVILGLVLQYGLMPLAALVIAHGLGLSRELTLGLVLVGSVAGGTASNVITFVAGGDVALSITLTSISTLVAVAATPLLTWAYVGTQIGVPVVSMLVSIAKIVVAPVAAGMLVNRWIGPRWPERDGWCALLSAAAIGAVIAIIVALNAADIATLGALVLVAVILHNTIGLAAGYTLAWLATRDSVIARTLAIEVGMQNSGLAVALAQQYFGPAAALPGAIFSVWHNVSGAALAGVCRGLDRFRS